MAWGLWNKIKNGFKKAGKFIRNVAKTVTDKVIKPFKRMISGVANAINPALGAAVNTGMDAVERFSDEGARAFIPHAKQSAQSWANKRWGKARD